jgi:hypothetical protein
MRIERRPDQPAEGHQPFGGGANVPSDKRRPAEASHPPPHPCGADQAFDDEALQNFRELGEELDELDRREEAELERYLRCLRTLFETGSADQSDEDAPDG